MLDSSEIHPKNTILITQRPNIVFNGITSIEIPILVKHWPNIVFIENISNGRPILVM